MIRVIVAVIIQVNKASEAIGRPVYLLYPNTENRSMPQDKLVLNLKAAKLSKLKIPESLIADALTVIK